MYTVSGDFSLMINWDKFFGSTSTVKNPEKKSPNMIEKKNPSMMTMLIPWIAFWIAVSIAPKVGALITLIVVAGIPFIMRNHEFVIWDQLSMIAVAVLSAAANVTGNGDIPTNIGYLVFGLFWLLSCLTKEPLCAAYVKYNYGGESAHQNPLFMKTNYILAAAWGLLYVLTAVWTFLLRRAGFGNLLIIVNNLIPILMGFFTMWFATGDATPPGRCHCLFFTIGTVNFSNLINRLSYTASFHSVICFPLQYQKEVFILIPDFPATSY